MNTKLLRQKILDLAIRGKLTDQRKSDGSATDLLKEIAEAKRSLSQSKGKVSKNLGAIIPIDKVDAPFEIPENWEWAKLGDLCFVTKLAGFEYSDYIVNNLVEKGIPLFKGKNIQNSKLVLEFESYVPENISDLLERSQLRKKCILTPYVGTIGNMAIFDGSFKAHLGSNVGKIEPYDGVIEEYLFHFLKSDAGYKQLTKHKKATAQESISIESIRDVFLPLPPLAEQQRIVAKIEEAFAEIDAVEKNKDLLKTHIKQTRQKILDLAIHGKLVPQDENDEPACVLLEKILQEKAQTENKKSPKKKKTDDIATSDNRPYEKITVGGEPFEIPSSWKWVNLGCIGKWQSGTTPSKSNPAYYKDGTIPWLNTGDLNDGIISEIPKKVTEKALAETSLRLNNAGAVCIAMYGATIGKLGVLAIPATTNQACCVCDDLEIFVDKMWLFYFLKHHKKEFIEAGFGGAQPNISKDKIVSTRFPLPPIAEQKRIVDKVKALFKSLDEISLHLI